MVLAARPMHYFISGPAPCAYRYDVGNAHGLFALSKILRQLALFLSLYHIKKKSLKYRPNQANCDDFCGTLFQNSLRCKLLRIKVP